MTHPLMYRRARLATFALGATVLFAACGDGGENMDATDTAAGAIAAAPAGAGTGSMEAMDEVPRDDNAIVTLISRSNAAEISSSQLAEEKATAAPVKEFARMMTTEHRSMDQKLNRLNIPPASSEMTQEMKDQMEEKLADMRGKSGADFDRAYMDYQVEAHQKTVQRLQASQNVAQNAELKTLIDEAIPKVQGHLQRAQQIRQGLGG